jgi:hypothetical protein
MNYSEAIARMSPEEFDRWHQRRMWWRSLVLMIVIWAGMALALLSVVFFCVEFVGFFCGDGSWPSGLFLAGLVLYCIRFSGGTTGKSPNTKKTTTKRTSPGI